MSSKSLLINLIVSAFLGVSISFGDFYLFHFILIITLILWIYKLKENDYKINISILSKRYVPTMILIFFWYLLSLIWVPNIELGFKYIFYLFCGITIFLSIIYFCSNIKNLNKVFHILSFLIFVEIAIALIESFTTFRMPISSYSSMATFFGKDPVNFSEFDNIFLYSNIRPPTGFRWNTNDLAICMIISLPFFLCNKKTLVKIFGTLVITTIVIMTASRAVFLSLILIYTLYLFFIKKRIGTLSLVWSISLLIIWSMTQLRESENPRINELANSVDAIILFLSGDVDIGGSLEWRRELVDNGLKAFFNSYGVGLGAGGSTANQEIMGAVAGRFTSMHNFWVELLVEGGLFVAVLILFWILTVIYKLFIISRTSTNQTILYYSKSLFLSMIAFIPAAVAASSTIYFFPMWILFGFTISVISLSVKRSI